jgi:capsular polysaccharide biosynthesis protein
MATTTPVLERVQAQLGSDQTIDDLAARLVVRTLPEQSFVDVSATAPDAAEAAALANEVAAQVTLMSRGTTGGTGLAQVVQPALVPTDPSSPNVVLNTAIAVLLSMLVGVGAAMAISESKRSRRTRQVAPTQAMTPYPW